MLRSISRHLALEFLLARAVGWYLSFAQRTTRWTIEGAENLAPHVLGSPAIMASWHERLPLMPMQWIEMRRMAGRAGAPMAVVSLRWQTIFQTTKLGSFPDFQAASLRTLEPGIIDRITTLAGRVL